MGPDYTEILKECGGMEEYPDFIREEYTRGTLIKRILDARSQSPGPKVILALLKDHKVTELLLKAADSQRFERACQYIVDFLSKPPTDVLAERSTNQESIPALRAAFKQGYIGEAVDHLHEYITDCDRRFYQTDPKYYGRFCSIVQSSGTGKSRTLIELMKTRVLGLYMNIRPPNEERTYPLRDEVPARILAPSPTTLADYKASCYAFFTAVFIVLGRRLRQMGAANMSPEDIVTTWSAAMCDLESTRRKEFFRAVDAEYKALKPEAPTGSDGLRDKQHPTKTQDTTDVGVQSLAKDIGGLNIEARQKNTSATDKITAVSMSPSVSEKSKASDQAMRDAYNDLVTEFPRFFVQESHHPRLVIAIDEVHLLGEEVNKFRRSHILCQIISNFSKSQNVSNWVIFASTTSKVADFSAPSIIHPSHRVSQGGQELFPPYSLFDWDQKAKPPGAVDPWEVSHFSNVVGFGRPLWSSLTESMTAISIIETACDKLCGAPSFDPSRSSHVLAVIGQRCCLDICFGHIKAVTLQVETVSSNLRVCLKTTDDRLWQITLYPSEPLLSCAAAQILHPKVGDGSTSAAALEHLETMVTSGMIEMGQKGELVSRILFLIGKDLFVRTLSFPSLPQELRDCKPIPVVGYLRFLFGDTILRHVTKDNSTVESTFGDWYINFSHWISMSGPICSPSHTKSDFIKWLVRHWFRTCAVQCYHNQESIDKLIPMFKFGPGQQPERSRRSTPSYDERVSFIVISDRARQSATRSDLNSITPANIKIPDLDQPYIAIQADLRVEAPKVEFDLITNASTTPSLRIYAAGIDAQTYKFMEPSNMFRGQVALKKMLAVPTGLDTSNVLPLEARLKYGEYSDTRHMEWERRE